MDKYHQKLLEMGLTMPDAPAPAANYVPWVKSGNLVYISGQVSKSGDDFVTGKLGEDLDIEQGQHAAQLCGLAIIAQLKSACDSDLSKVKRIIRLTGFVNSTPDFAKQPLVINGASDLMVAVFGERGRHARAAVSAASLPTNVAVEIDAIAEIDA